MSCGVGRRCSSDLVLLWLWCKLAATALIRLLAWEPPYASGAALKRQDKQTNKQTHPRNTSPQVGWNEIPNMKGEATKHLEDNTEDNTEGRVMTLT